MSRSAKPVTDAVLQEYGRLKAAVRRFEEKGLYDTAHHTMLNRLLNEYPQLENSAATTDEEVEDGE